MSEFKGTKGKWEYKTKSTSNRFWIQVEIPNKDTINVGYKSEDDCTVPSCCCTEIHANALLISKAPEMLEMLKRIMVNYDKGTQTYLDCQKLIKQATEI